MSGNCDESFFAQHDATTDGVRELASAQKWLQQRNGMECYDTHLGGLGGYFFAGFYCSRLEFTARLRSRRRGDAIRAVNPSRAQ